MKRREDVASKGSAVEKVVVCCRRNAKLGPKWEVGVWWCWGVLSFCDASVQFTTAQGHVGYFFWRGVHSGSRPCQSQADRLFVLTGARKLNSKAKMAVGEGSMA